MNRLQILIASSLVALTSCVTPMPISPSLTVVDTFTVHVRTNTITVKLYADPTPDYHSSHAGFARPIEDGCTIYLNEQQFRGFTASVIDSSKLLAHEVGHCLDWLELGWDHNGWDARGEALFGSDHYAKPAEGYAEAFAQLYVQRCGYKLEPLLENDTCIPAARDVR